MFSLYADNNPCVKEMMLKYTKAKANPNHVFIVVRNSFSFQFCSPDLFSPWTNSMFSSRTFALLLGKNAGSKSSSTFSQALQLLFYTCLVLDGFFTQERPVTRAKQSNLQQSQLHSNARRTADKASLMSRWLSSLASPPLWDTEISPGFFRIVWTLLHIWHTKEAQLVI